LRNPRNTLLGILGKTLSTEPSLDAIEVAPGYPEIELNSLKLNPILLENCETNGNLYAINAAM